MILVVTSCEYTEIDPIGETLPNNIDALTGLLNYPYANGGFGLPMYMTPDIYVQQGVVLGFSGYDAEDYAYNFEDYFYETNESDIGLERVSSELNYLNVILENIDDAEATEEEYNFVKQTALIRRAHIYYLYLNAYCTQYTSSNASESGLGWINKYTENYDADMTRMTLQESYDLVIADLESALEIDLPRQKYSVYGSTEAANGLLAMVYMTMGNYSDALTYCNLVLDNYNFLYDYSTMDPLTITSDLDIYKEYDDEKVIARGAYASLSKSPWGTNNGYCSTELISLFTTDDMRSNFLYPVGVDIKWYGARQSIYDASCSVPLLMLYKAECLARDNQVTEAMNTVNALREKRFVSGSTYQLTAADQTEALAHIYDESRRELAFTAHSFINIRRLNALHNANISISRIHTESGESISLPANDLKWTLPIPRYYIDLDPELTQNPRN